MYQRSISTKSTILRCLIQSVFFKEKENEHKSTILVVPKRKRLNFNKKILIFHQKHSSTMFSYSPDQSVCTSDEGATGSLLLKFQILLYFPKRYPANGMKYRRRIYEMSLCLCFFSQLYKTLTYHLSNMLACTDSDLCL